MFDDNDDQKPGIKVENLSSLEKVAREFKRTRERIRQIEKNFEIVPMMILRLHSVSHWLK